MGKPRLESVNDVVELVVESPAWNKKECYEKLLEEMDPTFRNVVDTHYKSFTRVNRFYSGRNWRRHSGFLIGRVMDK